MDTFKGDQHHSSPAPRAGRATAGKRAVVIGSNNSAHDICAALWEHGADVTMVQRSSTHVVALRHADGDRARRAVLRAGGRRRDDHREGRPDLRLAALPRSWPTSRSRCTRRSRERDADFYARLEKAGFLHDFGEDGSGPVHEVPAPRRRATTSTWARPSWSPTARSSSSRARSSSSPRTPWCSTTAPSCRPTWSSTPPAMGR